MHWAYWIAGGVLCAGLVAGVGTAAKVYWMTRPRYYRGAARKILQAEGNVPKAATQAAAASAASSSSSSSSASSSSAFLDVGGGIRLYYERIGACAPSSLSSGGRRHVVLLVHGSNAWTCHAPWMQGLRAVLDDSFEVYSYHQRGCGQSTRPFDSLSALHTASGYCGAIDTLEYTLGLAQQVADIERIRLALQCESLVLIGHSWGGFLSSLYAADFPERVSALFLISPPATLSYRRGDSTVFTSVEEQLKRLPEGEKEQMLKDFEEAKKQYFDFSPKMFERREADVQKVHKNFLKFYRVAAEVKGCPVPPSEWQLEVKSPDTAIHAEESQRFGGWSMWAQYFSLGFHSRDWRPC